MEILFSNADTSAGELQGASPGSGKAAAGLRGGNTGGAAGKCGTSCAWFCGDWGAVVPFEGPSSETRGAGAVAF